MQGVLQNLAITFRRVDSLKPHPRNARLHSKFQLNRIAASLKEIGVIKPILIDSDDQVIAGNGVLEAAKLTGISDVPTIRIDHLTPDQIRAYMLADNKLAELSGWNSEILVGELQHLLSIEGAFDITITGFDVPDIDLILDEAAGKQDLDDVIDARDIGPAVSTPGQSWALRKHRVVCANALLDPTFKRLFGNRRAGVVFIDPPFNVPIDGHVSGKGRIKHREFAMASGEMTEAQFVRFLSKALRCLARYSRSGSVFYVCMDWRHIGELIAAAKRASLQQLNVCVWVKNNGGMGSFYRSQHEFIFVFRSGSTPHRNNIQLGRFGRNRTNVWTFPGANTFARQGEEHDLLAEHPSPKPVAMIAEALLDCSARGDIVLDSFLGSGSTLLAAERTGRVCYGIEIDPLYVDLAIRRWERFTGDHAVDVATGKRFSELAEVAEAHHG